jgi:hypothetical protein
MSIRFHVIRGLIIITFCLLATIGMSAETTTFGEISDEEWAMGAPDQCPDAKAIILFDDGYGRFKKGTLDRHIRIKILSKEGSEKAAEIEIPVYRGDKVKNLKAHTVLPDGSKLEVKEFFEKTVDEIEVQAFTFPSIQDGCIIEYQYQLHRKYYYLPPWYFQNDYYTIRSAYSIDFSSYYRRKPIFVHIPSHLKEELGEFEKKGRMTEAYTMKLENLMPIEDEPLMGARLDNLMSVSFVNRSLTRGVGWYEIGEAIGDYWEEELGNSQKDILRVSDSICAGLAGDDEKIAGLYDFTASHIVTNNDIDAAGKLADIMKNRKGHSFEKNLLLVELIKAQDLPARQLLIGSRKEHDKVNVEIKSLNQFDRTLCYVERDTSAYVLNPGARCAIFPFPESDDLAEQGLLIDGEDSRLLDIPHQSRTSGTDLASTIFIDETGHAVCSTTVIIKGYSMERWREKQLDSLSNMKIMEEILEDVEIDYEIVSANLKEDFTKDRYLFEFVLKLPEFVSILDNNFFFTPCLLPVVENPFLGDARTFPIDFNYAFRNRHIIRVILPPNMVVADIPKNIYQTMQEGKFTRKTVAEGNEIHIQSELRIKRPSYPTALYKEIKDMFDIMSQSVFDQVLATSVQEETGSQ